MSKSSNIYISDILESVNKIFRYMENKTEFDFLSNIMLQDAVLRRLELIGKTASRIVETNTFNYADFNLNAIESIRTIMMQKYFEIKPVIVYQTIQTDLPILKAQLQKIV